MDVDQIVSRFLDAMASAGVNIDTSGGHPRADGKLHRADAVGKKRRGNKHVWYTLHADGVPSGAFGDFQTGLSGKWCAKKQSEMSDDEVEAHRQRVAFAEDERARERAIASEAASHVAMKVMRSSTRSSGDHEYLTKKSISHTSNTYVTTSDVYYTLPGEGGRKRVISRGCLFIPAYSHDRRLVGGQVIYSDGKKLSIKGTEKKGAYHPIGLAPEQYDTIVIAEGWATAARIHHVTGFTCAAAFDAGNLKYVAVGFYKKYPNAQIVIAADNDRFVEGNPGVRLAMVAASESGACVAIPRFRTDSDGTDFDDLFSEEGAEEVKRQILSQIPVDASE